MHGVAPAVIWFMFVFCMKPSLTTLTACRDHNLILDFLQHRIHGGRHDSAYFFPAHITHHWPLGKQNIWLTLQSPSPQSLTPPLGWMYLVKTGINLLRSKQVSACVWQAPVCICLQLAGVFTGDLTPSFNPCPSILLASHLLWNLWNWI